MSWKIVLFALAFFLLPSFVLAVCSMDMGGSFNPGETILFTMNCTNTPDPDNDNYVIKLYNSTGDNFDNVSGVAPSNAHTGIFFFNTYMLSTEYPVQDANNATFNITLSGTQSSQNTRQFNVSGLATNKLSITEFSVLYNGDWYWNEQNAIRAIVHDYEGNHVVGAVCKVDLYESVGLEPYYTQDNSRTGADGDVIFNIYVDYDIFDHDVSYEAEISCQTLEGQTLVTSGNISVASGAGSTFFTVNPLVENIATWLESGLNETSTQTSDNLCINFTNSYRDYSDIYEVDYQLVCDVPNQDITVFAHRGFEALEPFANGTFCPPIIIPESAALGTGYCRIKVGVNPGNAESGQMFSDYSAVGSVFKVNPSFLTLVVPATKINITTARGVFTTRYNYTAGTTLRVSLPRDLIADWNWDKAQSLEIIYNGTIYPGRFVVGRVSPEDAGVADIIAGGSAARAFEIQFEMNQTFISGTNLTILFHAYSEASFWQGILSYLGRIASAIEKFVGISSSDPIGNYTNITSSLVTSSIGSNQPVLQYSITASNSTKRKDLHFQYEFAPLTNGVEGAFTDQNPEVSGYQPLDAYQVMVLNQSKSFNITLYPSLVISDYLMYETIYEISGDAPERKTSDERIIRQHSYILNVTQEKNSEFNGDVIQFEGIFMQVLS